MGGHHHTARARKRAAPQRHSTTRMHTEGGPATHPAALLSDMGIDGKPTAGRESWKNRGMLPTRYVRSSGPALGRGTYGTVRKYVNDGGRGVEGLPPRTKTVHLAQSDAVTGGEVAVKKAKLGRQGIEPSVYAEIRSLQELQHPNVVRVGGLVRIFEFGAQRLPILRALPFLRPSPSAPGCVSLQQRQGHAGVGVLRDGHEQGVDAWLWP